MSIFDTSGVKYWSRGVALLLLGAWILTAELGCSEDRTELFNRPSAPEYWNTRARALFWFNGANKKTVSQRGLEYLEDSSKDEHHARQDDERHAGDHGEWPPTGGVAFDVEDWMNIEGPFEEEVAGFTILASFRLDQPAEEVELGRLFSLGVDPVVYDLTVQRGALKVTLEGNEYDLGIEIGEGEPLLVALRQYSDGAIRVRLNGEKVNSLQAEPPALALSDAEQSRLGGGMRFNLGMVAAFPFPLEQEHLELFETSLAAQFYCCKP